MVQGCTEMEEEKKEHFEPFQMSHEFSRTSYIVIFKGCHIHARWAKDTLDFSSEERQT